MRRTSRRTPLRTAAIATCTALIFGIADPGLALFMSAPPPPAMSASTATLAAPTSPAATRGLCVPAVSVQVLVTWVATTSTFADGYEVRRATTSGGPYTTVATVDSLTTSHTDTGLAFSTTYHYVIRATRHAWRSADTGQASVTTQNTLCL